MTVNTGKVTLRRHVYYATFDERRAAVERMKRESHRSPSPILAPLSREEADRVHLTHSAMHMSFLIADEA